MNWFVTRRRQSGLDDTHDVFFAHDEQFLAVNLDGLTGILAEQDTVTNLDVQRHMLAVLVTLAGTNRQNFALIRLFGGSVRNDDTLCGFTLLFEALDDHAIMQRTDFH